MEQNGGWARLTLNRPGKLNSVNAQMRAELAEALAAVDGEENIRALLITGAGRAFCAGQDLQEREIAPGGEAPDLRRSLREGYNPLIWKIASMPKPVVCAVNGVAAGAGVSLAMACDFVFAAESARFVMAFCGIGLVPDSGATWFLPRAAGLPRARAMMMTGEPVDAKTAAQWGMIYRCVADGELAEQSETLAAKLARAPTSALGRIKRLLIEGEENSLPRQLEREAEEQGEAGRGSDYAEGVRAFLERRPADFTGR